MFFLNLGTVFAGLVLLKSFVKGVISLFDLFLHEVYTKWIYAHKKIIKKCSLIHICTNKHTNNFFLLLLSFLLIILFLSSFFFPPTLTSNVGEVMVHRLKVLHTHLHKHEHFHFASFASPLSPSPLPLPSPLPPFPLSYLQCGWRDCGRRHRLEVRHQIRFDINQKRRGYALVTCHATTIWEKKNTNCCVCKVLIIRACP